MNPNALASLEDRPEPPGPPPFSIHENADFMADMAALAPHPKIRDEICAAIQCVINRLLAGLDAPGHAVLGEDIDEQLLITERTGTTPALRIVFSVVDEYPKRHIYLHAASVRDVF
jgi:hypothetical protein